MWKESDICRRRKKPRIALYIRWLYDAEGNKLRKLTKTGTTITTTDYAGGIEYKNSIIDAIYHSEGRLRAGGGLVSAMAVSIIPLAQTLPLHLIAARMLVESLQTFDALSARVHSCKS